jgi:hypothetical protein
VITYRASRTFDAPIKYVYEWATDYTEGDNQIWGGKHRRVILLKSRTKAVYTSYKDGSDGKPRLAVRIVTFSPAKYSWHLDYYGEEDLETGDYRLLSLGREKTRLDMLFRNQWKKGKGPSAEDFQRETNEVWEKYAEALERDYNLGKKAK